MSKEPLAARMRPRTFDDVVGQPHLIGRGKPLTELVRSGHLPSLILWGPAGSGKTTIAYLLAAAVGGEVVERGPGEERPRDAHDDRPETADRLASGDGQSTERPDDESGQDQPDEVAHNAD